MDRAALAAVDLGDRRGRRSAATSCGARRGGRCRCAPGRSACRPRRRRSRRPSGRSSAAGRRRRRCSRAWARRRCGGGPPRPCAGRAAPARATTPTRAMSSFCVAWNVSVPLSVPKSLVLHRHRHLHVAAAEQRAERPDRDLLERPPPGWRAGSRPGTRSSGSPCGSAASSSAVHRLVVALRPRRRRTSSTVARRSSLVQLAADQRVAAVAERRRAPRGPRTRRSATGRRRRAAPPPARADLGGERNSEPARGEYPSDPERRRRLRATVSWF